MQSFESHVMPPLMRHISKHTLAVQVYQTQSGRHDSLSKFHSHLYTTFPQPTWTYIVPVISLPIKAHIYDDHHSILTHVMIAITNHIYVTRYVTNLATLAAMEIG